MNDLKLFYTTEKRFESLNGPIELVTFDTNLNKIYGTDHEKLYEFDAASLEVRAERLVLLKRNLD